jgi:ketosteroid isomerase-like protein
VTHDEIDDLATRFFTALEQGDVETVAGCYAPDAVVWHNYDQVEQPRAVNLLVLRWVVDHVEGLRYDDIRRLVVDDGFVQQHVLRGTAPDGTPLEVPAMMRVTVVDDLVTRIDEYLDTAQVAALTRPVTDVRTG